MLKPERSRVKLSSDVCVVLGGAPKTVKNGHTTDLNKNFTGGKKP